MNAHTREKDYLSITYTMYANTLNNNTFLHSHYLYVVWKIHPLGSWVAMHILLSYSSLNYKRPLHLGMCSSGMWVVDGDTPSKNK